LGSWRSPGTRAPRNHRTRFWKSQKISRVARERRTLGPRTPAEKRAENACAVRVHFKAFFGVLLWSIKTRARA
jgi:hypothetical protein